MKLKDLKKGDFFLKGSNTLHPQPAQVWIRGEYDRSEKKYLCRNFADANAWCMLKGDKEVSTDFIF